MDIVDLTEKLDSSSSSSSAHHNSSSRSQTRLEDNDDDVVEVVTPISPRREKVSKKRRKRSWELAKNTSNNVITVLDDDDNNDEDDVEIIDIDCRLNPSKQRHKPPNIIPANNTPMNRILELFPDIKRSHVNTILGRVGMLDSEINVPITTELDYNLQEGRISTAIQNLVEDGMAYPKEEVQQENVVPVAATLVSSSQRYRYDYSAPSLEYKRSHQYNQECFAHLLNEVFPFMTKAGLTLYLDHCKGRYYLCHTMICDKIRGKGEKHDDGGISKDEQEEINLEQLKLILRDKRPSGLTFRQKNSLQFPTSPNQSVVLSSRRARIKGNNGIATRITDPILLEEIIFTTEKFQEWSHPIEQRILRRTARKISEQEGTTIECQCCYGDCAWEEMVSCREEGHLFCADCLRRYAEERVFGFGDLGKSNGSVGNEKDGAREVVELTCMHGDGCTSVFAYDQLTKALPPKIMKKYDELQASLVVEKAGMKNLCKCPKCDFQAMLPETEMLFHCPNCQSVTCRKCGEPPHIPLRCEEVEKKNETNARLRIEEAMTKARVRSCPKCAKKFYKVEGCNKMCCPSCQTYICYVCRKQIDRKVGYKHFCQAPHCNHKSCGKCPLYSKSEEDDLRAAREAGIKTAEMLNVLQSKEATVEGNHDGDNPQFIRLDLEKILEYPAK